MDKLSILFRKLINFVPNSFSNRVKSNFLLYQEGNANNGAVPDTGGSNSNRVTNEKENFSSNVATSTIKISPQNSDLMATLKKEEEMK